MSPRNDAPGGGQRALLGVAVAAIWAPLIVRWSRAWSVSPDQAFGWGVPLLAAYLLWARAARQPPVSGGDRGAPAAWFAVLLLALVAAAADLVVLEANSLWPTAQFGGWVAAAVATYALFRLCGGRTFAGWHLFPFLFLGTALTWPTPVKTFVVSTLSGTNAMLAAEAVSAAGHPAVVNGNVIAVSTGLVGIEEACSGMRSLQAIWMVAWFAGEFFLLNWPRRLFLVATSLAAALAANLGRTIFLTWIAAAKGTLASERWHDAAGNAELALGLVAVAALSYRAHRGRLAQPEPTRPSGDATWHRPAAAAAVVLALATMASGEAFTQYWYRSHERAGTSLVHWRLNAPGAGWSAVPVPARERDVLGSSDAEGFSARPPVTPFPAWTFLVNWEGNAARSETPEWHDPAICLPAAGAMLVAQLGATDIAVGGRTLPFSLYRFAVEGRPVLVYFCHWDAETAGARREGSAAAAEDYRARRWQRVREGRRQGDVAHIAFILATDDAAAGLAWLRSVAPRLLHPVAG